MSKFIREEIIVDGKKFARYKRVVPVYISLEDFEELDLSDQPKQEIIEENDLAIDAFQGHLISVNFLMGSFLNAESDQIVAKTKHYDCHAYVILDEIKHRIVADH